MFGEVVGDVGCGWFFDACLGELDCYSVFGGAGVEVEAGC